jgi:hypothetical protein
MADTDAGKDNADPPILALNSPLRFGPLHSYPFDDTSCLDVMKGLGLTSITCQ